MYFLISKIVQIGIVNNKSCANIYFLYAINEAVQKDCSLTIH